jgi:hypothetical protein
MLVTTLSIINFTLLNAAFGSPPSEDLTGQAIINPKAGGAVRSKELI